MNDSKTTSYSKQIGYRELDVFKIAAQKAALGLGNDHYVEEPTSRGESAFVSWEKANPSNGICSVIEGLGTKNIVAEAMYRLTKDPSGFGVVSKDTIAMIVNDMITVGGLPSVISMHFAVGTSDWMKDEERVRAVIDGWREGCRLSGAIWGGGETPSLGTIIHPDYPEMSGSAFGVISKQNYLHGGKIKKADQIIFVSSSGIHANGLTAARKVADKLPDGYLTKLNNGLTFGDALLQPTINYVPLMRKLIESGVELHYAINITGYGWRKIMRAEQMFQYVIHQIPKVPEVFDVIEHGTETAHKDMYLDYNMGVGFALIVPYDSVDAVLTAAEQLGYDAMLGGEVRDVEPGEGKSVVIEQLSFIIDGGQMKIR